MKYFSQIRSPGINSGATRIALLLLPLCLIGAKPAESKGMAAAEADKPELVVQNGHSHLLTGINSSWDGKYLLSTSMDRTAKLWNIRAKKLIQTFRGHENRVFGSTISKDGRVVYTVSSDKTIRTWSALNGKSINTVSISAPEEELAKGFFSLDGQILLTYNGASEISAWDTKNGRLVYKIESGWQIYSNSFSETSRQFVGHSRNDIRVWDTATGREITRIEQTGSDVMGVAFSTDGSRIVATFLDKTVKSWKTDAKYISAWTASLPDNWLEAPVFCRNDKEIIGASTKSIYTFEVATGKIIRKIATKAGVPEQLLCPNGSQQIFYRTNEEIFMGSFASGQWASFGNSFARIYSFSFLESSLSFLLLMSSGWVFDFDFRTNSMQKSLIDNDKLPRYLIDPTISKDGLWRVDEFVPGRELSLRNYRTRKKISLTGQSGHIEASAISSTNQHVATGSSDGVVKIWAIPSGALVRDIKDHKKGIKTLAFSPDGAYLATASWDKTVKVWQVPEGKLILILNHESVVTSICFSRDNGFLITGSADSRIRVWHQNGKLIRTIVSPAAGVKKLNFSIDEKFLGALSSDNLFVFRMSDGNLLAQINNPADTALITTPDGRFDYTDKRALEYVSYRVGEKFVDLQEVHDYYYTPGLLKMVLDDTLPTNETGDLGKKLKKLPDIQVLSPSPEEAQDKVMDRKLKFAFRVKDTGGGGARAAVRVKGKLVWESPAGANLTDMQEVDLTLDGGPNQVSVTAYNRAGGPHTETIDLRCADVDLKKQSTLFILSVGVNEYNQNPLTYSVADAKKVVQNFEERSKPFFKEVIPVALYDKDATLGRIQKEIRAIQGKAGADDVVMLYFSGHGLSVKEESGKKLFGFIPQDYPWRGDEATTLRRFGLTHDYLALQVKAMKPTKVVIIMDACHSGDAQLAFAKSAENNDREILEKLANGTGVFMLTSSAGKQLSREDPKIGHGIFTYVLLEGLADKAADVDGDGVVSIKELSGYMTARFESRAQKIMGKNFVQTPVINSMGRSEASAAALDFPLARVR